MKIALTGDVMLGRMVDQSVIQNRSVRPEDLGGDVLPIMLAGRLPISLQKDSFAAAIICPSSKSLSRSSAPSPLRRRNRRMSGSSTSLLPS
jgi:hypothetical protein